MLHAPICFLFTFSKKTCATTINMKELNDKPHSNTFLKDLSNELISIIKHNLINILYSYIFIFYCLTVNIVYFKYIYILNLRRKISQNIFFLVARICFIFISSKKPCAILTNMKDLSNKLYL